MGLDVTSYSAIAALPADWEPPLVNGERDWDELYERDIQRAYTNVAFPRAMDGLEGGHDNDKFSEMRSLGSRWYQLTGPGPKTHASYSGHGDYRDELTEAFWTPEQRDGYEEGDVPEGAPFIDLIYFSDCEGLMGPEACARLHADYVKYPELGTDSTDWNYRRHQNWAKAVEHASHGGCLRFH